MADPMDPRREVVAVELAEPSPLWAQRALDEAAWLSAALGDILVETHHIGSTAIPGIRAKPIIDLMAVVTALAALDALREPLEALGYEWRGEYGIAGRRYCAMNDPLSGKRVVQLHMYERGDPQIARHLNFRNYLRTHPGEAAAYEAEKIRAAGLKPHDTLAYNDEKSAWIQAADLRAKAWAEAG